MAVRRVIFTHQCSPELWNDLEGMSSGCVLTEEYPIHKKIQTLADGLLELRQQIEEIKKYFPIVVPSD